MGSSSVSFACNGAVCFMSCVSFHRSDFMTMMQLYSSCDEFKQLTVTSMFCSAHSGACRTNTLLLQGFAMFSLEDLRTDVISFTRSKPEAKLLLVTVDVGVDRISSAMCLGVLVPRKLYLFGSMATKFASSLLVVRLAHCTSCVRDRPPHHNPPSHPTSLQRLGRDRLPHPTSLQRLQVMVKHMLWNGGVVLLDEVSVFLKSRTKFHLGILTADLDIFPLKNISPNFLQRLLTPMWTHTC